MNVIPDYSNVNLSGQQYAGGSNGAYFANDEWNNPWLVKSYPGATGQDRTASELLANAVYRTMGANAPQMGIRNQNGRTSIAYPLAQGNTSYFSGDYGDMAKRRALGQHFATDALVGNWDFAGLDDDNVLWDDQGNPIRIDPGGSFEFRAQGSPKAYGPNVDEMDNLLTIGQGRHGVLTSEPELRQQAAHIANTLTPDVVHGLVHSMPFQDKEMQQRIHDNLNARVNWMKEFANGQRQLSPEAQQTLARHQELLNQPRISASADELHISLKVPRYPAKALFRWARDQKWPEGTQLEDFNEYHVTMLYAPYGYSAFHNAWWANPDLDVIKANVVGFDNFGPGEQGYAYVLRLESEELQQEAEKLQVNAAHFGIRDTHFGSYKPHITIGYGPAPARDMQVPNMELDLGPAEQSSPRQITASWDFDQYTHFHPWTGKSCNCFYGSHRQRHIRKTAGQNLNKVLKDPAKSHKTPEGQAFLEHLKRLPEEYDALTPYLAQRFRKGDIRSNPDYEYMEDAPHLGFQDFFPLATGGDVGPGEMPGRWQNISGLDRWNQWYNARQHPTRQGVNVMDPNFTPLDFRRKVDEHQKALREAEARDKWIENYAPNADVVHRFGPEAGKKYNGWQVVKLDPYQAEGDSEALGHCIGQDSQPYKHNIEQGNINAYSLRDKQGYPHVSWHFNPSGEDIGHMQGKGGYPNETYRNLITQFHNAHGLPDIEGGEDPLDAAYDDEYELPAPQDMWDYVQQCEDPHGQVPWGDQDRIGPETIVIEGYPDWSSIAHDYLRNGERNGFFNTLKYLGHGDEFAHALEKEYDPSDREHRQLVDYYNSEGPGTHYIPVDPVDVEDMGNYHDLASEGKEPDVSDWDAMANDYFNYWQPQTELNKYWSRPDNYYQFQDLTQSPNPTTRSIYHDFVPSLYNQGVFTPNQLWGGGHGGTWSGGWDHRPEMQNALTENVDWNDPYHQEAIQYWNSQHPQHGVFNDTWNVDEDGPLPPYFQVENDPNRLKLFNTNHGWGNDYQGVPNWKDWNQQENPEPPKFLTGSKKVSSMQEIAENLHQKYMLGTSPTDIVDYARHLLGLVGYPNDDMSVQAALQAWQMMYPDDQILEPGHGWQVEATNRSLYHGTIIDHLPSIQQNGLQPDIGPFIQDAYQLNPDKSLTQGEETYSPEELGLTPAVYMTDKRQLGKAYTAMTQAIANKLGIAYHDVTPQHIADHGLLVKLKGGQEGYGPDMTGLQHAVGEYDETPYAVEGDDWWSEDPVGPHGLQYITGPAINRVMNNTGYGSSMPKGWSAEQGQFFNTKPYIDKNVIEQRKWSAHSSITAGWDFNSGFENLIDQYAPYGLSCLYDESPDTIDISHLEVDPRLRSQGIGSKFMNAAHQYAQSVGKKIQVSRVDNVPFFSKFPFLNQVEDKKFVTAMWDGMQFSGSPVAAKHSFGTAVPGDEQYYNQPLQNLELNPHAGEHSSWIANDGENKLYVKPESQHDFHQDSPVKERAAFVLGNAMGMNVPHTVVRRVQTPLEDRPGQRTSFASVHHGVPNTTTLGHMMNQLGIRSEYYDPEYNEFLEENAAKRRQMLLLDQIIGNPDRHSGNLLIDHNGEWYPIDHGAAFQNIGSHGPDWYLRYSDFENQPLTPEELQQVQAARAALDHPANRELFSQPELYPERLNQRVNTLLNTGKFQPFSWTG